jgi:hypothetical protein
MIVVANSGSINFKKTGTIRTGRVLSKKSKKKCLTFFWYSCQYLKSAQFAGFFRISQIKTPSPMLETGFYDPSICSPF